MMNIPNLKFNIFPDTKIYVHVIAGKATGGIELLHQLVGYLRDNGRDAYIVFFGECEHKIHSDYSKYNLAIADVVEDSNHNIEVYSETIANALLANSRSTQKFFWWLSVDNFFGDGGCFDLKTIYKYKRDRFWYYFKHRMKMLLRYHKDEIFDKLSISQYINKSDICGYQCEYIHDFLIKNGFKNLVPLYDYINTEHLTDIHKLNKEDVVLYNPSKGYEFTKQLIDLAPDISWVPLRGYSRIELIEVIRKSKLYIDFGNHPGKDRLPRECAINGCCIITGKRGAAAFYADVPISSKYKFDEYKSSKADIISMIRNTLTNYSTCIDDFSDYRLKISNEKEEFESQISYLFDC